MADYLTINSTVYLVQVGKGRGELQLIQNERRVMDFSLATDRRATKWLLPNIEITGEASDGRFFTPTEGAAFMDLLLDEVEVTLEGGISFTARARGIGFIDGQHYPAKVAESFRWVTATLEEV